MTRPLGVRRCGRAGVRDLYAPIVLVAPDSAANRHGDRLRLAVRAPTRRAAMLQARDSGNATLTALVQLRVDAGPGAQAGLPDLPAGLSQGRVHRQRARSPRGTRIGWVRAAVSVGDLMSTLYGEQSPGLVVRVHDGADTGHRVADVPLRQRGRAAIRRPTRRSGRTRFWSRRSTSRSRATPGRCSSARCPSSSACTSATRPP